MENLQDRIIDGLKPSLLWGTRHLGHLDIYHFSFDLAFAQCKAASSSRLWCRYFVGCGRVECERPTKTFNIYRFVKTHNMVDKPRSQSLKEWSNLTQWNPCIRSSQHGYTWIYSCRHEPGPSNCNSESGLQVEYRVLCKANHLLKTLGSRFSMCFDWLVLITYFENWFQHVSPTTSPNHSSQGFSTAFGKPASKFWTSQCTASCLDVLAMLASMVGFLCCSFKSFEAVEVDRVLQSSAKQLLRDW